MTSSAKAETSRNRARAGRALALENRVLVYGKKTVVFD